MGNDFKPPNRKQIAGDLLDINAKKTLEASISDKLKVADVFGLTFLGDFATVERMPLLNIVMCCGDLPPSIVAIKECTSHLQAGGKKDASYVADELKRRLKNMIPPQHLRISSGLMGQVTCRRRGIF